MCVCFSIHPLSSFLIECILLGVECLCAVHFQQSKQTTLLSYMYSMCVCVCLCTWFPQQFILFRFWVASRSHCSEVSKSTTPQGKENRGEAFVSSLHNWYFVGCIGCSGCVLHCWLASQIGVLLAGDHLISRSLGSSSLQEMEHHTAASHRLTLQIR